MSELPFGEHLGHVKAILFPMAIPMMMNIPITLMTCENIL